MRVLKNLLGLSILVLALSPRLLAAQGSTATLGGVVRDEQNLVVPGATVTVAGTESSFSRTAMTTAEGGFDFPGLLPGEYLLTSESGPISCSGVAASPSRSRSFKPYRCFM
jgi:hypothetical protein